MNGVESSGTPFSTPPVGPAIELSPPTGRPFGAATPDAAPEVHPTDINGSPLAPASAPTVGPAETGESSSRRPRKSAARAAPKLREDAGKTPSLTRMERGALVKHPRDWRWYVGGLGRILIALGLLIFAFVAYQLWGTGIQYAQHQDQLKSEFAALLAQAPPPVTAPIVATTTAASPDTTVAGDGTATSAVEAPTTVVAPLHAAPLPPIGLGDPIAFIEIPSIGLKPVAVVAGVRVDDLKKGVGHFPASPMPGQPGNAALAGHRTTYGQPFFNIDKISVGDEIIITTLQGRYVYRMTGQQIVKPSDGQVVANQPDKKMLTLTSCTPKFSARDRIVVTADLDEPASSPLGAATTNSLDPAVAATQPAAPVDTLPGDEPEPTGTVVEGGSSDTTLAPPDDTATATTDGTTTADTVDTSTIDTTSESIDALSAGWFSDPDAWPQIALWGAALSIVALLAWRLSVRARRNWVGALVGIAPFVFVLYFFFENVNRLLPPNL